ncbi:hypothetical protein HDV00_011965 [Rhizophlyctis rosea]|nr:hypothetical protein HDV00_011965 [Rhizophlyctis rosea]
MGRHLIGALESVLIVYSLTAIIPTVCQNSQKLVQIDQSSTLAARLESPFQSPLPHANANRQATTTLSPTQRLLSRHPLNQQFTARYTLQSELGSGGFGFVVGAVRVTDTLEVAVKFILKSRVPPLWARDRDFGVVPMEIYLLKHCRHDNIVGFIDYYEDARFYYLVMEMHGGRHVGKVAGMKRDSRMEHDYGDGGNPIAANGRGGALGQHPAVARIQNENGVDAEKKNRPNGDSSHALNGNSDSNGEHGPETPSGAEEDLSPPPMMRSKTMPLPPRLLRKPSMDLFEYVSSRSQDQLSSSEMKLTNLENRRCIERNDRLPENTARHIFQQIASAVAYLHTRGIVHRDIKDENIIVDKNFNAKLIDFGSATVEPKADPSAGQSGNGGDYLFDRFQGTIQYASPEILRGEKYSGRKADIWALGILLVSVVAGYGPDILEQWDKQQSLIHHALQYTILFGEVPFANSEQATRNTYKSPRYRVSYQCMHLVDWMLQKKGDRRPTADMVLRHPWIVGPGASGPGERRGMGH